MDTTTIDRVKGRGTSADETANDRTYRPFDRDAAISLVDAVRRAMPGTDAVTGLRAVRTLATLRNHPARQQAFANYLNLDSDGTMAPMSRVPDPYLSRKHEQRGDDSVWRYGMARVQGRSFALDDAPNGSTPALVGQMLEDLPRNQVGRAALDVYRLTQLFYGDAIPALLATDVASKRSVVTAADSVDPNEVPGVLNRYGAVCTLQTWPSRYRLPAVRVRKSEAHYAGTRSYPAHADGTECDCEYGKAHPWQRETLLAAAADSEHVWVGHKLYPRGKRAERKARSVKVARTIAVKTLDTLPAVFNAVSTLNRGERIVITYKGSRFTITRGKGKAGTYQLTPPAGKRADGIRTAETVVRKVSELVA